MRTALHRARVALLGLLALVAAYGVIGAFVVPPLAKRMLVDSMHERLGRPVVLDHLFVNPYTLEAQAKGLRILERDGRTPFASFETLDLVASLASIRHLAPVVDQFRLGGLRVHLVRDGDSHYNVSDILERLHARAAAAPARDPADPVRFAVSNIRVVNAAVSFDDQPAHAMHRVEGIQLAVPSVSNLPTRVKDRVRPSLSAMVNGAPFRLDGEAVPFADTVSTRFNLDLRDVDLRQYLGYVPAGEPVKVKRGRLDARIALRFSQAPGRASAVDLSGTAAARDLEVADGETSATLGRLEVAIASLDPLGGTARIDSVRLDDIATMRDWKVAALQARGIDADLRRHSVRVASVETRDGRLTLTRRPDGSLEMPRLADAGAAPGDTAAKTWDIAVASLTMSGYGVTLADQSVQPSVTHRVLVSRLDGSDLTTGNGMQGRVKADMRLEPGGTLGIDSTFALDPLDVKAAVDARSIDLVPVRAYVSRFPAVALKSGLASAKGIVTVSGKPDALTLGYDGSVQVDRFATWDTLNREDLLNWKRIRTRGVKLRLAPRSRLLLDVADVDVEGAYSRIFVNPQGKLNVQQLITATSEQPDPPVARAQPTPARDIRIERIRFAGSRLNFTDHYIRPNYTADVGSVEGTITHLSSDPSSRAKVMLKGRWDAASPVLIAGTVNPLRGDLALDIAAKGEAIDLTKLTAYSQRYAGYGITAGRLTLDVRYKVQDGKLDGRNRILVDQLQFGDKVESPDATKLPVLFVVNLLKDKDGRINLELPISGSLEDPSFDIGAVIGQVFSSHFAKAETSPFALLAGSLGDDAAGDDGGDLAFVDFDAGQAQLSPAARKKLDTIVKMLQDRPGLKLEVASPPVAAQDVEALKAAELQRRLAAAPKDLSKEAREKLAAQPVEVPDEARNALSAQRVAAVKAYLVGDSRLPVDRVAVASAPEAKPREDAAHPIRVDFALR
ncbi:MAG TPA: DUF748 domain-containing protein [Usitatibacter sp.]|jgi:uncharacterized protein involved in outer membrane biogenesis|nr:DUF748 domain-containing protein [Usitatibacter sp.]